MGTSTVGSELHSDKLAKLQARKKELEALLAAKNEDLYKLCVQEVKLTGVMPPEAPAEPVQSPVEPREDGTRRARGRDVPSTSRKQICHRLSTPSISGLSIQSVPARRADRASASCSTLSHDSRDSFSLHSSQTYPTLQAQDPPASYSRHHTLTTERVSKLHYSGRQPDTQSFSRETHFSSSHPDITTQYSHTLLTSQPVVQPGAGPLLYQYASQLRARSPHLSSVPPRARRGTLQRTQTYHLTAHSDHPSPGPSSPTSVYSGRLADLQDQKVKEKEWYESSLDSPTGSSSGMNLSRESAQYPRSPEKVAPSPPPGPPSPSLRPPPSPASVPLESPKNCTVVESGKWIPYREVSKPFEMSDFYKYSTKFRQNAAAKPRQGAAPALYLPPDEVRTYSSPEQWRQAHPL